jgi:hypothetical protein
MSSIMYTRRRVRVRAPALALTLALSPSLSPTTRPRPRSRPSLAVAVPSPTPSPSPSRPRQVHPALRRSPALPRLRPRSSPSLCAALVGRLHPHNLQALLLRRGCRVTLQLHHTSSRTTDVVRCFDALHRAICRQRHRPPCGAVVVVSVQLPRPRPSPVPAPTLLLLEKETAPGAVLFHVALEGLLAGQLVAVQVEMGQSTELAELRRDSA